MSLKKVTTSSPPGQICKVTPDPMRPIGLKLTVFDEFFVTKGWHGTSLLVREGHHEVVGPAWYLTIHAVVRGHIHGIVPRLINPRHTPFGVPSGFLVEISGEFSPERFSLRVSNLVFSSKADRRMDG
jgi:hypothetical protein